MLVSVEGRFLFVCAFVHYIPQNMTVILPIRFYIVSCLFNSIDFNFIPFKPIAFKCGGITP